MYTLYIIYYMVVPKKGFFLATKEETIADYRVVDTYKTENECVRQLYKLKNSALFTIYFDKERKAKVVAPEATCVKNK